MSDTNIAENADAAGDVHTVLDHRDFVILPAMDDAEGSVMANVNVVANGVGVEDHAAVMPYPDSTAQFRRIRQGDAAGPLDKFESAIFQLAIGVHNYDYFGWELFQQADTIIQGEALSSLHRIVALQHRDCEGPRYLCRSIRTVIGEDYQAIPRYELRRKRLDCSA